MYLAVVYKAYDGYVNCGKISYWKVLLHMTEFNPSKTEKTVITLRIEMDVLQEIDALSGKADISRNEFIMQCINFAMKHHPNAKSDKQ